MIERCHGHASDDEFRETVRDLRYHGDVMNLIVVSNPVVMFNCEIKKDIVLVYVFTNDMFRDCPCAQSDFPISTRLRTNLFVVIWYRVNTIVS